jgi:hypothetical protein
MNTRLGDNELDVRNSTLSGETCTPLPGPYYVLCDKAAGDGRDGMYVFGGMLLVEPVPRKRHQYSA